MSERQSLLASIAAKISDYRASDLPKPAPEHVDRWIQQFDVAMGLPILRELDQVLKKTYFSLHRVTTFLESLLRTEKLVGKDVCAFWGSVRFLNIQGGGNSQREMLQFFSQLLQRYCGFPVEQCGNEKPDTFVYLDDAIFTGNRVRRDLEAWIQSDAPQDATVHVVSIVLHSGGRYYANGRIGQVANAAGKKIQITWWHAIELEDRKAYTNTSDVLRPTAIPADPAVQQYVEAMIHKPNLRKAGNVGTKALFSSENGRSLLEQEFLKAGVRIRQLCPNLGDTQRPLGHSTLETLGFGSLIVTFRNCPNNAPLALWVGDPWYPMFPRTTNSQTEIKRMFEDLTKGGT